MAGRLVAGPRCPVETVPPLPACAPLPVAGATVVATDVTGREVARTVSKGDGSYVLDLAPGTYTLTPSTTLGGTLRAPKGRSVTVAVSEPLTVDFTFDTGIR